MRKKVSKFAFLFCLPVVVFMTLAIFLVSGLASGYVSAVSGNGGGFFVRSSSKLELNGGTTITGNSATNGGGVYVDDGGELTIGDYVYFGSYPKTYQSDTSVITNTTDENGYYLGTDGNRYAKISANLYNSSYVFNDGTTIVSGKKYYFKVEPIKWRILKTENGKALLLCEEIITAMWFDDLTSYSNNYANSEIRAYLNGYSTTYGSSYLNNGFLQTAFTTAEQNSILTTTVDNSASTTSSTSNTYACENTNDKIFLLSYQDMINTEYGFSSSYSAYDTARRKQTTDYARANYAYYSTSSSYLYNGRYWLRSPSSSSSGRAHLVYDDGTLDADYGVDRSSLGVVPALYISASELQSCSIFGNTATSGNGHNIYNAGTFTMTGGTIGTGAVRVDENGNPSSNGNYVLFGSYPKTYQSDTSVITTTQDENGYYIGTDGTSRYAKVSANPSNSSYVFNDGTTIVKGTEYYFKVEPLKWRILKTENGKALLLCEDIIDAHHFYSSTSSRTINGSTIYANNYKYSDIRAWLNGYGQESGNTGGENWLGTGFLQKAFTTAEQNSILTTEVENDASTTNSSSNSYVCENTNDKIFLLSYQDMINTEYGFNSSYSEYDTARRKQTTDYARANYAYYNTSSSYLYNGYWWLRSPSSSYSNSAYYVSGSGFSSNYRSIGYSSDGVVPALYISESLIEQTGYGIYNTGTMNLYGGTIYDDIYSETSFNTKVDASILGTITLGDGATITVEDYSGTTPEYNITLSSSRPAGTILTLQGSSTTPDLTKLNIIGYNTNSYMLTASKGSSSTEWNVVLVSMYYEITVVGGTADSYKYKFALITTRTLTPGSNGDKVFTGWTVSWTDLEHSTTLPTVSDSVLTIPAGTYGNITVKATWDTYKITFNTNGGSSITPTTYTKQSTEKTITVNRPTRSGYTFNQWNVLWTDSGSTKHADNDLKPTISGLTLTIPANCFGNITLKAYWSENSPIGGGGSGSSYDWEAIYPGFEDIVEEIPEIDCGAAVFDGYYAEESSPDENNYEEFYYFRNSLVDELNSLFTSSGYSLYDADSFSFFSPSNAIEDGVCVEEYGFGNRFWLEYEGYDFGNGTGEDIITFEEYIGSFLNFNVWLVSWNNENDIRHGHGGSFILYSSSGIAFDPSVFVDTTFLLSFPNLRVVDFSGLSTEFGSLSFRIPDTVEAVIQPFNSNMNFGLNFNCWRNSTSQEPVKEYWWYDEIGDFIPNMEAPIGGAPYSFREIIDNVFCMNGCNALENIEGFVFFSSFCPEMYEDYIIKRKLGTYEDVSVYQFIRRTQRFGLGQQDGYIIGISWSGSINFYDFESLGFNFYYSTEFSYWDLRGLLYDESNDLNDLKNFWGYMIDNSMMPNIIIRSQWDQDPWDQIYEFINGELGLDVTIWNYDGTIYYQGSYFTASKLEIEEKNNTIEINNNIQAVLDDEKRRYFVSKEQDSDDDQNNEKEE